jgi:hypothetical protein
MKTIQLILQAKGGVGKSLFTWFDAEKDTKTSFIDLDESTQTSANRLESKRIRHVEILNDSKHLEREKSLVFLNLHQMLNHPISTLILVLPNQRNSENY